MSMSLGGRGVGMTEVGVGVRGSVEPKKLWKGRFSKQKLSTHAIGSWVGVGRCLL